MYAAEKEAIDLDPRRRHLDHQGPTTARRAGRSSTRSRSAPRTSSAVRASTFTANKKDVAAGQRLETEIALFDNSVETWAKSSGHLVTAGLGGLGGLLVLAGFAGVIAVAIWNPFSMTMIGLIPGAFAVCGTSLMATGSGTKRTRQRTRPVVQGRRLPPDAGDAVEQGTVRLLGPRGALHRLHPVGGRPGLRQGVGREVPHRDGRRAAGAALLRRLATPASSAGGVRRLDDPDFGATVDSAISSYNATQSSSSRAAAVAGSPAAAAAEAAAAVPGDRR